MTIQEQEYKREFSLKEVCDILSGIMCVNRGERPQSTLVSADVTLEHSDEVVKDLVEHIIDLGLDDVRKQLEYDKYLIERGIEL